MVTVESAITPTNQSLVQHFLARSLHQFLGWKMTPKVSLSSLYRYSIFIRNSRLRTPSATLVKSQLGMLWPTDKSVDSQRQADRQLSHMAMYSAYTSCCENEISREYQ